MKKAISFVKNVVKNNRGTVLMEKKVLLVVIVIGIFGFSSIAYPFIKDYFNQSSESIKSNSKINESVSW